MHENFNKDNFRDKMLTGEINREDCDEKNVCKCLTLLKRTTATQVDNAKELTE